jgi:hypothetical protein
LWEAIEPLGTSVIGSLPLRRLAKRRSACAYGQWHQPLGFNASVLMRYLGKPPPEHVRIALAQPMWRAAKP